MKKHRLLPIILSASLAAFQLSSCGGEAPAAETTVSTASDDQRENSDDHVNNEDPVNDEKSADNADESVDKPAPAGTGFVPENDLSGLPVDEVFEYTADSSGVTITGVKQYFASVKYTVPDTIDGKPVTAIGENCFACPGNVMIAEMAVVLPDSIEVIGRSAFNESSSPIYVGNVYLEVNYPKNLRVIGEYAFCKTDIADALLPDSVTEIGEFAFADCSGMTSAGLGSVSVIPAGCFNGCESLTDVKLPDTLTEICDSAFSKCSNLKHLDIPAGVRVFGSDAFSDTPLLDVQPLVINNILVDWSSASGSVAVPDGITAIARHAFHNNKNVTSVTIPDSVSEIGTGAFALCKSLESVTLPSGITEISDNSFDYCKALRSIDIPDGVVRIGRAFKKSGLENVTIPASVIEIDGTAFNDTPFCETNSQPLIINDILVNWETASGAVTIPDGVVSVSSEAFYYCEDLTDVTFPASVEKIGAYTFIGCRSLKSVNIPDTAKEIGKSAFAGCESLTSVNIPAGIISGGDLFIGTPLEGQG